MGWLFFYLFLPSMLTLVGYGQNPSYSASTTPIQTALRARDFQNALQLAESGLSKSPRNIQLLTLQGMALSGLSRNREALETFDKALLISPDYLPALQGAAQLNYEAGSVRAIPLLNRILHQMPNDVTSHAMLAFLSFRQHDCETAVKHFSQSVELISSQPAALAAYGSCLIDLGRPQEAILQFQQLVAKFPEDGRARYSLAVAQLSAHNSQQALDTLKPLLDEKAPDPDALDVASSAYEELGGTPKAVELLRQAIVTNPKKAKYYLDFATLSFNHQSFQVGIDMLNTGLATLPNVASLYVARGILYIQLAQYDKGQADFQTATRLDPGQTSGAVAQGMAQIQQSNLDEALTTVKSQLKSHPQEAFLYYLKAQILVQKGAQAGDAEFKEAVSAANRAVQLNPEFVLPRDILGSLYLKSGQLNLAIEQCRAALHGNSSDQEALYHLIQALRQSGKGSKSEMAELVKRLAELRQQSRQHEAMENKYKLYEPDGNAPPGTQP